MKGPAASFRSFLSYFLKGGEGMLVLTRKRGESVQIGVGIMVTVLEIGASRIKLGVSAPAEVAVWRAEVKGLAAPLHLPLDAAAHAPATPTPRVQRGGNPYACEGALP
jgi:carbon storage regulator CsrA